MLTTISSLPCDAASQPRSGLKEFILYLSDNNEVKPIKQFPARATFAEDQPMFTYSLPLGDVVVYPEFLVFLTIIGDAPGMGYFVKSYFQEMAEQFKAMYQMHKWANNPATFLLDMAKHFVSGYSSEDKLAKALSCPNSIFVPFSAIRGAMACNSIRQANYIKVASTRGAIVLCKDSAIGNPFANLWSHLSGDWHSDVVAILHEAAKKNAAK